MNEQFRELLLQARKETDAGLGFFSYKAEQRFAELLIQQCIRTLRSNGYDDAAQCLHDIHFGIEDAV
jgi:hypothetical protein